MAEREKEYRHEYAEQSRKLCLLGCSDKELAEFFGVDDETYAAWVSQNEELQKAILAGKREADANVADRLYNRAIGYSHEAVKIFMPAKADEPIYATYTEYYPPDVSAAMAWLTNRKPDKWKQRQEVIDPGGVLEGFAERLVRARERSSGS